MSRVLLCSCIPASPKSLINSDAAWQAIVSLTLDRTVVTPGRESSLQLAEAAAHAAATNGAVLTRHVRPDRQRRASAAYLLSPWRPSGCLEPNSLQTEDLVKRCTAFRAKLYKHIIHTLFPQDKVFWIRFFNQILRALSSFRMLEYASHTRDVNRRFIWHSNIIDI